jgi:hypothetical protein
MKLLVDVEDRLYGVVADGKSGKVFERITDGFGIDNDGLAGREAVDIDAEALGGFVVLFELEAGLGLGHGLVCRFFCAFRDHEDEVTVQRSA